MSDAGGRDPALDFGLGLRARHPSQLADWTGRAQRAGFTHVWLYDSPRFAETWVAMTACALTAPALTVGTLVTNTETRDVSVTANAVATLSALTDGRVVLGLGLGDSAVRFIGGRPSPFGRFRDRVEVLTRLLSGESVTYNGRRLSLAAPPQRRPRLLVTAESPRTFEFAGTASDGGIISPGSSPRFVRYAVEHMRQAARQAGRDPDSLYVAANAHCVVADSAEDALATILGPLNRTLFRYAMRVPEHVLGLQRPLVPDAMRHLAADLVSHQDREFTFTSELRAAIGDEVLHELVIAGTPEDCYRRIEALAAVPGLRQVIVNFHAPDPRLSVTTFEESIIPAFATPAVRLGRTSQEGGPHVA